MFKSWCLNNDSEIFGCSYECPFQDRKQDCPFTEIDQFNFKEKVDWLKFLTNEEIDQILKHHLICLAEREHEKFRQF